MKRKKNYAIIGNNVFFQFIKIMSVEHAINKKQNTICQIITCHYFRKITVFKKINYQRKKGMNNDITSSRIKVLVELRNLFHYST